MCKFLYQFDSVFIYCLFSRTVYSLGKIGNIRYNMILITMILINYAKLIMVCNSMLKYKVKRICAHICTKEK